MGGVKVTYDKCEVSNDEMKEKFDLDTVLRDEVGQFGWFQVKNIIMALVAVMFVAWTSKSFVFTTARIPSRCYIPECDTEEQEFTPSWLLNAVPGTSLFSFDNCQRYSNVSTRTESKEEGGVCPATLFNREQLQRCERWLYQNTDTVVYDFQLACNEWHRTFIGTFRNSAALLGHPLTGFVSDRWGRRTALVACALSGACLGILGSFANSYILYVFVQYVEALFGGGVLQAANILLIELVRPESRVLAGTCLYTSLSLGYVFQGFIAWAVPNWRQLTRVLYVPQLVTIMYIWLMSESVRWYISKGRFKDSKKTLETIARVNKKHLSDRSLELLKQNIETKNNQGQIRRNVHEETQSNPSSIKALFQHKSMILRCLVMPFLWVSFTIIYHGLAINSVDISGNKYVSFVVVAAGQIPGYWITYLFLDKIGRRPVLSASYCICAACLIGFMFMPKGNYALSLLVYMMGAICSGAMLNALYIYTAELFPTQYRHRLFAACSSVGRLGSIIAPMTPALGALVWEQLPFALFAGCACAAGALVLLTPETRGVRLPETVQEAADIGRKTTYTPS